MPIFKSMFFQQMLPIDNPVWKTALILAVILIIPDLCRRLRFPQIAGLIVAGVILGPGLAGIMESDATMTYASRIGLLFIMFFAGIQIDLEEMKRNRVTGVIFGLLTFFLPFGMCLWTGLSILGLDIREATVIGCIMGFVYYISRYYVYGNLGKV